jgi:hypothetical protein
MDRVRALRLDKLAPLVVGFAPSNVALAGGGIVWVSIWRAGKADSALVLLSPTQSMASS